MLHFSKHKTGALCAMLAALAILPCFPHAATAAAPDEQNGIAATDADQKTGRPVGDVDLDGTVSASDARVILRAAVSLDVIPESSLPYADVNEDGAISAADAREALRVAVELDEAKAHRYLYETAANPTCTETGRMTVRCEGCGVSRELQIPALGHRYRDEELLPATCTSDGKNVRACATCGNRIAVTLPATGHRWPVPSAAQPRECLNCGLLTVGWNQIEGTWTFFNSDGTLPGGGSVQYSDGAYLYCYNGVPDSSYRGVLYSDGKSWIVREGIAQEVITAYDRTLYRAFLAVDDATTPDMTMEEKLYASFVYVKTAYREYNPRSPHYLGEDWPILYANDMFVDGGGNCFSYAAAFAFMAKAIGYENVYCCNSGGHGWAEIDGLVYDPEWSRSHSYYSYYGLNYYEQTDVNYRGAIAAKLPWMYVEI